jgi:ABC-type iron transport system FetAB ATPase subunit
MDRGGLRVSALTSRLAGPFDLDLDPGRALAISGPSGAGKSLLLRMIADLDPHTGEVWLNGVARSSRAPDAWRRLAPYVAAESGWWAPTVAEHFQPDRRAEAQDLALRLGLSGAQFAAPVDHLSTGERQRLALVRALVLDSPLLLLDEPTGPLDPAATAAVEAVLGERLRAGAMIILSSHDPDQGRRLAARRLEMRDRRLSEAHA